MSSRREVLIRILALLQRKTLIKTKNRTLKSLKWNYSTVRSMKNVAVLTEDGVFVLFFVPTRGIWQLKSPHTREFAIQGKKNANARGSTWRGLGAGGIDWCIILEWNILHRVDSLNICTPKNSKHLRLHSRAIMALDHSRLGLLTLKILANKSEGV